MTRTYICIIQSIQLPNLCRNRIECVLYIGILPFKGSAIVSSTPVLVRIPPPSVRVVDAEAASLPPPPLPNIHRYNSLHDVILKPNISFQPPNKGDLFVSMLQPDFWGVGQIPVFRQNHALKKAFFGPKPFPFSKTFVQRSLAQ